VCSYMNARVGGTARTKLRSKLCETICTPTTARGNTSQSSCVRYTAGCASTMTSPCLVCTVTQQASPSKDLVDVRTVVQCHLLFIAGQQCLRGVLPPNTTCSCVTSYRQRMSSTIPFTIAIADPLIIRSGWTCYRVGWCKLRFRHVTLRMTDKKRRCEQRPYLRSIKTKISINTYADLYTIIVIEVGRVEGSTGSWREQLCVILRLTSLLQQVEEGFCMYSLRHGRAPASATCGAIICGICKIIHTDSPIAASYPEQHVTRHQCVTQSS
jgi:hypothetical protein